MIETIRSYVAENEQAMLGLLEKLIRINSYTPNKAGTDAVADEITQVMTDMGFTVQRHARETVGDNLVAENQARQNGRGLMLCGHMDTVFPPEDGFDCFRTEGDTIVGPGVVDMKGGLVVGIFALQALQAAGQLDDMPVAFVFNSDEETGSAQSKDLVIEQAKKSDIAFVFECGSPGGKVVTGRKGKLSFVLDVTGQAGHSGNLSGPKPSAILELAHKTVALESLNDAKRGVSVNVGIVSGGVGPNTIAPKATAKIECRYWTESDGIILRESIEKIAATPTIPGTTCDLTVIPGRPTMERSNATGVLYDIVAAAGADLDIQVAEESRGGVSDANFIANAGTPVIDGMGPIGGKDHSHDEYMITSSFAERTILAALTMRRAFESL